VSPPPTCPHCGSQHVNTGQSNIESLFSGHPLLCRCKVCKRPFDSYVTTEPILVSRHPQFLDQEYPVE